MTTSLIKSALSHYETATQMSIDAWVTDQELRAENVQLYRDYADGNHRGDLTQEMRDLLRIGGAGASGGDTTALSSTIRSGNRLVDTQAPFNLNRMDNIIQTMVDRLEIKRVEDTGETANDWLLQTQKANRFDALQIEVHEAAIRDADTFILVDYDNDEQEVRFTHEPAYDGVSGMLVMYQKRSRSEITCAIKVWHITSNGGDIADTMRVNVYYPDRIEKFTSRGNQALEPYLDDDDETTITGGIARWVDKAGEPLGVPVVHFKNKAQAYDNYGRSEIDDAIPGQDALNRLMYSMVASAELGGFPVRVAKGFTPPAGLTPGAWVVIGGDGLTKDDVADAATMEQAVITPYLEGMHFIIEQVDEITRTPNPKLAGDSASGESLKQREIGLLGKIKRCHINFGNAWEDVFEMAHAVQMAYGETPPEYEYFDVKWRSPEIRNTAEIVQTALTLRELIGDEATIRLIANEYDWTEDQIQDILDKKRAESQQRAQDIFSSMPTFNNFQRGANGNGQPAPPMNAPTNGNGQQQGVAAA